MKAVMRLSIDSFASPLGELRIVVADGALCALEFAGFDARMHELFARRFPAYELIEQRDPFGIGSVVRRYFDGDIGAVDELRVDGGGTPYQQRVWAQLRMIPAGATRTYGEIAARLSGTHPRAVGHANSLNPIAIVVPCHRAIGAAAALTGYAGGLHRKRWLLDHEAHYVGRSLNLFARRTDA